MPSYCPWFPFVCVLLCSLFVSFGYALPLVGSQFDNLDAQARRILERSTPASPHFVVYSDASVSGTTGPPDVSEVSGFNVFILSFLLTEGAYDKAEEWTSLTAEERSSIKKQYADAGISLIVSLFGSTDAPTTSGQNAVTLADTMASWIIEYDLDGADIDYEDMSAFEDSGEGVTWLIDFTKEMRNKLPVGSYILTHAPVAPWFSPNMWSGSGKGGYLTIDSEVGDLIDWYNVQFYNQGSSEYTTCSGLFNESSSAWPESSVFQIAANGVSLDKIVVGKPATSSDASNGYMSPSDLATCMDEAQESGYNGGVMVWEFPGASAEWISTVRGSAWPVGSTGSSSTATGTTTSSSATVTTSSVTATTSKTKPTSSSSSFTPSPTSTSTLAPTSTSSTPTTSSTSSTGSTSTSTSATATGSPCGTVAAWSASTTYWVGDKVAYNGQVYSAKWWSTNNIPGGNDVGNPGVWATEGGCDGASSVSPSVSSLATPSSSVVAPSFASSSDVVSSSASPSAPSTPQSNTHNNHSFPSRRHWASSSRRGNSKRH